MSKTSAKPERENRYLFLWLWRNFLSKYKWYLFLSIIFMAIEGSMLGAISYMMQPMFDNVFAAANPVALWGVGLTILAIFITRGVTGLIQKVTLTYIQQNSAADLRMRMLDRLMEQDSAYHQTHPPGYLIQRVQTDVQSINGMWTAMITGAGRDTFALIALLAVAINVDWKWTLIAFAGIPVLVLPSLVAQRFVRRRAREARDIGAGVSTQLDEVFHGIIPVKLNRLEDYQASRFRDLARRLVRTEVRVRIGAASLTGLVDIMAGLGFLAVLVFGGGEIISGEKTVGEFMSFFTALSIAFEPLRRLGNLSGVWQVAASAIERLQEIVEAEPTLVSPPNPKAAPTGVPEVRLQDVQLAYGEAKVLRGASFTAEAGKTTAIVGASGAGKSTVFNILTRLVDPQSGKAKVQDVPVDALDLGELRDLFSVVSQEALLFDETLRENILLGRTDVSKARLKEVLDAAHVSDFLKKLPDGLDTPVGPRGTNLSGGQRQRVVIARALLRDKPILLLDEATSALDAQSETVVQKALERLSKGRTTLVIAHRLSTVRDADKIVVMDKGRVVDEGRHEDLLKRGGIYADLHQLQFTTDGETAESRALQANVVKRTGKKEKPKRTVMGRLLKLLPRL
ncbi:ABC transporter ATP-binding protein [Shimia sediminis]|uniref:ABC transporter ATP-binding protein n=1 Tax=Shimia sediminis TaxID=2497945 RepID=UPI0027B9F3F4|nr:ABC transporter ATP-binding protein [Shimia sediminis]